MGCVIRDVNSVYWKLELNSNRQYTKCCALGKAIWSEATFGPLVYALFFFSLKLKFCTFKPYASFESNIPPSSPSTIKASCKTKPYIDDSITYICHAVTICNPSFIASIHLALKAKVKELLYRVGQHYVMMLGICRGLSSSYVKGSGRCLSSSLSHVDPLTNRPCMVDITAKNISARVAHAQVHNCHLGCTATFSAPALSNILANF